MTRLPPRMAETLELAHDAGQLVRYPGGYWAEPHARRDRAGRPERYADAQSVKALVRRGVLQVLETIPGKSEPRRVEPCL